MLDVLLLAAVFESYRKLTFKHFLLDPAHYVSSPSLYFDAMLRLTGVKLDVLHDTDVSFLHQIHTRWIVRQLS